MTYHPLPLATQKKCDKLIDNAALMAAVAAGPGTFVPMMDVVAMTGIWIKLIKDVSEVTGHPVNSWYATKFTLSVLSGAALYVAGSKIFGTILSWTGAGTLVAVGTNAALNWIYTQRLGKLLVEQFSRPDFSAKAFARSAMNLSALVLAVPLWDEIQEAVENLQTVNEVADMVEPVLEVPHELVEAFGSADVARSMLNDADFVGGMEALTSAGNQVRFGSKEGIPAVMYAASHAAPEHWATLAQSALQYNAPSAVTEELQHLAAGKQLPIERSIRTLAMCARQFPEADIVQFLLRFRGNHSSV